MLQQRKKSTIIQMIRLNFLFYRIFKYHTTYLPNNFRVHIQSNSEGLAQVTDGDGTQWRHVERERGV